MDVAKEREPPESLAALARAQRALAEAIERTRNQGEAYLDAPLAATPQRRDAYWDALREQQAAEEALYAAKAAMARGGGRDGAGLHDSFAE